MTTTFPKFTSIRRLPSWSIAVISSLLVLLFLYASLSKLVDLKQFEGDMLNQPFPHWLARGITWTIPFTELLLVLCLLLGTWLNQASLHIAGLLGSFALMSIFTLYTGLILLHFFPRIPCGCGGVIRTLTWKEHLCLNVSVTLFAGWAAWSTIKNNSVP